MSTIKLPKQRMIELYEDGLTVQRITDTLNKEYPERELSVNTVKAGYKLLGLDLRKKPKAGKRKRVEIVFEDEAEITVPTKIEVEDEDEVETNAYTDDLVPVNEDEEKENW